MKTRWDSLLVSIALIATLLAPAAPVHMVLTGWLDRSIRVFTGGFTFIGDLAPVAQACAVLAAMWYLNYWLYRRRIFLKL